MGREGREEKGKEKNMEDSKGQILLYQTPGGESRIEVRLQDDTVWLSLDQMADLFQRNKSTISRHIKNVFEEGELSKELVVANFATTTQHGLSQDGYLRNWLKQKRMLNTTSLRKEPKMN